MSILEIFRTRIELISTIQSAIASTFKGYSNSAIISKTAFLKNQKASLDVSVLGVIWLTDEQNKKTAISLGFSEATFKKLYENTFNEQIIGIDEENKDLAGELVNIIFQTVDPELRIHDFKFNPSLPEVLTGKGIEDWSSICDDVTLVLPCAIGNDIFYFELSEVKGAMC
jgi:CheY-specific phosphatase CheX